MRRHTLSPADRLRDPGGLPWRRVDDEKTRHDLSAKLARGATDAETCAQAADVALPQKSAEVSADPLSFGASDLDAVAETFREIAAVAVDDGMVFDPTSVTAEDRKAYLDIGVARVDAVTGNQCSLSRTLRLVGTVPIQKCQTLRS